MLNVNGTLVNSATGQLAIDNRGYAFGDALFETLKVLDSKILFWEDHYFRLMASMRILRMEIPMNFTMEYLEQEILKTIEVNGLSQQAARVKLTVDRGEGGKYMPLKQVVNFSIVAEALDTQLYAIPDDFKYTVDLYKDYFVAPGLLSTLKTNNKIINVLGSIFADENRLDNCLLLNTNKQVIEALNGNLFLVKGQTVKTPPLEDGCLKGIMRKQLIEFINKDDSLELEEASISPFELQQADELFITNVITGLQPVTNYRKKIYEQKVARALLIKLNAKLRLS
ncbi:branched-chain amino acid aminotransferase [Flavobacteriaceae bacterium MAR_2010_72]|nr:branched-chain amino acid aminotransferase [Flavobacteriaceae bacterium MAR_2010_72]